MGIFLKRIDIVIIYVIILGFILFYFTGCAPKENETACGVPNQYQCVNLCDGLFVKRQSNWFRYFKNELDCNVERNLVYEEYK